MRVGITRRSMRFRTPLQTSYGTLDWRDIVELEIEGDDGVPGRGEAAPLEPYDGVSIDRAHEALERYRPILEDGDALAGGDLLDACRAADDLPQALAAVDMALWDRAGLRAGRPVLVPVRLDLSATRDPAPLLRGLVRAPARRAVAEAAPAGLAERLAGLGPEDRAGVLVDLVRRQVADVLGHPDPGALDVQRGLLDQGLDSLTAVELRNRLGAAVGHQLPPTLIFDHPTVTALAGYLDAEVVPAPISGLTELDRLEELLLTLPPEHERRALLTGRLREVLVKAGVRLDDTAALLDDADDDEIFDFIDNELGR